MSERYNASEATAQAKGIKNENALKAKVEGSKEYIFNELSNYSPVMNELYASLYEERVAGKISFENGGEDQKILSLLDKCSPDERERIVELVTDERFSAQKNTTVAAIEILGMLLSKERGAIQ